MQQSGVGQQIRKEKENKPRKEKPHGGPQAAAMITTGGRPAVPATAVRVPVPATAAPARAPEAADN